MSKEIKISLTKAQARVLRLAIDEHQQHLENNGFVNSANVLQRIREKLDAAQAGLC